MEEVLTRNINLAPTLMLKFRPFVTSDDIAVCMYLKRKEETGGEWTLEEKQSGAGFQRLYGFFSNCTSAFFKFFGIKSSDYKNHASKKSLEFNSIFLSHKAVGSNS